MWDWLDGKKTAAGLVLVALTNLTTALSHIDPQAVNVVQLVGYAITLVGALHKLVKASG